MTKTRDLTTGNPVRLISAFSLPILLGNLFQQLYNMTDTMIVGRLLGDAALASVGATSPAYGLVISLINGACSGFSIIIARYFGAKDEAGVRRSAAAALTLGVGICAALTVVGLLAAMPILRILGTPQDIIDQSHAYLSVLFACMLFTMLYNLAAGVLRALGNSMVPLVFLAAAVAANIGLDLLFVGLLGMGVAGAAWTTVLAQLISAALCLVYIIRRFPLLHLSKEDFRADRALNREMLGMGASIGLSFSIVQIGSLLIQSAVNSLGTVIVTAHTAARRIIEMGMLPMVTMGTASATFASQNMGAGHTQRIRQGLRASVKLSFLWATGYMILIFLWGTQFIQLLTGTQDSFVIGNAAMYVRINVSFYYALGLLFIYRQTLQGLGYKFVPIFSSVIELGGKATVAFFAAPAAGYLGVCLAEPVIWILSAAVLMIVFHQNKKLTHRNPKHKDIKQNFST